MTNAYTGLWDSEGKVLSSHLFCYKPYNGPPAQVHHAFGLNKRSI